jgi:hypothetical protein
MKLKNQGGVFRSPDELQAIDARVVDFEQRSHAIPSRGAEKRRLFK